LGKLCGFIADCAGTMGLRKHNLSIKASNNGKPAQEWVSNGAESASFTKIGYLILQIPFKKL
tara:strand:+ start:502 stop:687 length:186 start_codon:yes stop_codon:yes gene_type:complete